MLQSKQRLLELNAKLAETLIDKGVTATADETTTALVNKVANITSGDDSILRGLIQRNLTAIDIPDGVTKIGDYAFNRFHSLKSIKIPNSVVIIGGSAFYNCGGLESVTIPERVNQILSSAFYGCPSLKNLTIASNNISILNSVFVGCNALEYVYLPFNFNNNLNLSASTLYTRETLVNILIAYADRTGKTALTLTIGVKNIEKLTADDIAIATIKNITLA